eukprot:scaffold43761_cov38-Tisochrysis_lutea.AAC.1
MHGTHIARQMVSQPVREATILDRHSLMKSSSVLHLTHRQDGRLVCLRVLAWVYELGQLAEPAYNQDDICCSVQQFPLRRLQQWELKA